MTCRCDAIRALPGSGSDKVSAPLVNSAYVGYNSINRYTPPNLES